MAKKQSATKAEKIHLDKISNMPCVLCDCLGSRQEGRTYVHHIRAGQGGGQRASHYLTLPLCYACHQGDEGLHGSRALFNVAKVSELDLLAMTIEKLGGH